MSGKSSIGKILTSLEYFKKKSMSQYKSQTEAFQSIEEWSKENNNMAIVDVSSCCYNLFAKLESGFSNKRKETLNIISGMFKEFHEYERKLKKLESHKSSLNKKESKLRKKILKRPNDSKLNEEYESLKDRIIRAEFEANKLRNEIEISKTILFKSRMIQLAENMRHANEAERMVLQTMKNVVQQIPDISEKDVDDIGEIKYDVIKPPQSMQLEIKSSPCSSRLYPELNSFNSPPPSYNQIQNQEQRSISYFD